MSVDIRQGDARAVLAGLPAASVHTCITSPPYFGLRSYGGGAQEIGAEETPATYVAHLVEVFRGVHRVLRDDGTLWCVLGDSYASSGVAGPLGRPALDRHAGHGINPKSSSYAYGRAPTPAGLRAKNLLLIPHRVALALQADGWYVRQELVWCLSGGTRVYARTQKGEMPMTLRELTRLRPETVQLWNGERWTQVLGWSRAEERDGALEIELRSGERIGCTVHHQWPTQRGLVRADELAPGDVLHTCRLPEPDAPPPEALDDRLVGWVCGLFLAEGHRTRGRTLHFAGHCDETVYRLPALQRFAEAYHGSVSARLGHGRSASVVVEGAIPFAVISAYIGGSSSHTKHLKVACWERSDAFLRALLEGYLAGDGTKDVANDRWRLGLTRNDALAADLRTLAARLGATLTLKPAVATAFGQRWPIYRGELRLERSGHWNEKERAEVIAIRPSRGRTFWHVGVADEPHLFALASGVLTSNSKPAPMPESVTDRCTRSHEFIFMLAKQEKYYYDATAIAEASIADHGSGNGYKRPHRLSYAERGQDQQWMPQATRNRRSVWTINTQALDAEHYAAFPEALVTPMVLAGTSEAGCCPRCLAPWRRVVEHAGGTWEDRKEAGAPLRYGVASPKGTALNRMGESSTTTTGWQAGCSCDAGPPIGCTVLDPFAGSGTTLLVARRFGRSAIGIELNGDYCALARKRVDSSPESLFSAAAYQAQDARPVPASCDMTGKAQSGSAAR